MDKLKDKIVKLQVTYNRIKKETVFFDTNMSNKMNKYFSVNKIHLLELNYIKNEFDLSNYFDIDINKEKQEHLSNIETSYIFYYSLKQKLKQLLKTLVKGQKECNDEYKKIVKEHIALMEESKKVILQKDKKRVEEEIILKKEGY